MSIGEGSGLELIQRVCTHIKGRRKSNTNYPFSFNIVSASEPTILPAIVYAVRINAPLDHTEIVAFCVV